MNHIDMMNVLSELLLIVVQVIILILELKYIICLLYLIIL